MRRIGNAIVRRVLRGHLHSILSDFLLLLSFTGRRSATVYTIPVGYAWVEKDLVVLVGKADEKSWWRNLNGGAPVTVRIKGEDWTGTGTVVDHERAAPLMSAYFAALPKSAKTFGVKIVGGVADPATVQEATSSIPVIQIVLDD